MEAEASHYIPKAAVLKGTLRHPPSRSLQHSDVCQIPAFLCTGTDLQSACDTVSVETSMSG